MPRIRTIKPELFINERCNEVSVTALLTFIGLLPQADDWGRHRDNAAIIGGVIWPMRGEHTPVHVEEDLNQLDAAGLIHRYTGCDGRRYLHVTGWFGHQKIEKRSQSRIPACTDHHPDHRCGPCDGPCRTLTNAETPRASPVLCPGCAATSPSADPETPDASRTPVPGLADLSPTSPGGFAEGSPNPPRALDRTAQPSPTPPDAPAQVRAVQQDTLACPAGSTDDRPEKTAGQTSFAEGSPNTPRTLGEGSVPGSRILDPGSSFPTGRDAPDAAGVSAKVLIGEYIASCQGRPPEDVIGHLGRITKKLLGEGIAVEHVRAGLRRYAEIQGHPSRLPSLVNDSMNAPAGLVRPGIRPTVPAHTAWTNPVDAAAYAEEL